MRIVLNILGGLMLAIGAVWLLQGLNVLKQSVMSGQGQWIAIGAAVFVLGLVVLVLNNWRRAKA
jgi:hypothetical protein